MNAANCLDALLKYLASGGATQAHLNQLANGFLDAFINAPPDQQCTLRVKIRDSEDLFRTQLVWFGTPVGGSS